jgi:hypothetical protein
VNTASAGINNQSGAFLIGFYFSRFIPPVILSLACSISSLSKVRPLP